MVGGGFDHPPPHWDVDALQLQSLCWNMESSTVGEIEATSGEHCAGVARSGLAKGPGCCLRDFYHTRLCLRVLMDSDQFDDLQLPLVQRGKPWADQEIVGGECSCGQPILAPLVVEIQMFIWPPGASEDRLPPLLGKNVLR